MKTQKTGLAKTILDKRTGGGVTTPDFQLSYRATVRIVKISKTKTACAGKDVGKEGTTQPWLVGVQMCPVTMQISVAVPWEVGTVYLKIQL